MVDGREATSDQKRGEEIDLAFGLPQKLLRTDEYPLKATVDDPLMSSNMSIGGVYDAQDAATRALYPSLLRAQAAGQVGVATALRYPIFTPAQWQELQRQALIYKHLVACVPVPPYLLIDPRALQSFPPLYPALARGGGYFGLRFPADSTDPEPGRCRRTDGKKWRCSRDVAPDQKYCERHVHRGRPRSRKPVERTQRNAATATASTTTTSTTTTATVKLPKAEVKIPFLSVVPEKETRYMDWMKVAMEGGTVLEGYQDQHQSSSYSDLNDPCYTFVNTELPSMDHHRDPQRSFIDAWSTEGHGFNDRSQASSSSTRLSPSMLTLSMSGCGEDHGHVQMGLVPTVGGPLGEVLRSGNVVSPKGGSYSGLMDLMGKSGSPRESPPRLLSSPTGVLQRTLVSLSDSSSNSSPTFAAGGRSEMGLQWAAQGKKW